MVLWWYSRNSSRCTKELKRLKEQGHKLFICSGRPKAMLDQKWWDGTFDGYVLNNGGYVEIDGKSIYEK